jgi:Ternary complex associated domain 9
VAIEYVPDDLPLGTFLVHCRPRITFHLGHIKMLNVLYGLLSAGHNVVIQIVPYDEHESRNRTLRVRLAEESEITKEFYRNYLGFDSPRLTIVNTLEQEIYREKLLELQRTYVALYDQGERTIKRLVDEHRRAWASLNILFVPKCIASMDALGPDYIICGEKHVIIAEAFGTLLRAIGHPIPSYKFADFKDLLFETAMDRLDSVHSYIDINDNEDFVLHKLSMLKEQPEIRSKWLNHFVEHIFTPAPERIKDGIARALRSEAEVEIALARFLASARSLIPYAIDDSAEIDVNWNTSLFPYFTQGRQRQITRIARQLFRASDAKSITMQRIFGEGKSGSTVLEIREHESDSGKISNVSILKIGPEAEMREEKQNYDRLISARKTAAFMAVKLGTVTLDGAAGIAYQDAQHYLGIGIKGRVDTIGSLFDKVFFDIEPAQAALRSLLSSHMHEVLYKHGSKVEAGIVKREINEFLPPDVRVRIDSYDRSVDLLAANTPSPFASTIRGYVDISEVSLQDRQAKGYTVNDGLKVELTFEDSDELVLNAIRPKRRMLVEGHVDATRRDYYDAIYAQLGVTRRVDAIRVADAVTIPDPVTRIDDALSREHYDYVMSPVHGDLHAGNVLYGRGNIGIIDYGKMRERFPALYDVAYLFADLKSRYLSRYFDIPTIVELEEMMLRNRRRSPVGRLRRVRDRLMLFEYSSLPEELQSLGSESLFQCLTLAIMLGRLKFDLPEHEKHINILLAHYADLKAS